MSNLQANHQLISISRTPLFDKSKLLLNPTVINKKLLHQQRITSYGKFRVTSLGDRGSALVQQRPSSTDEEKGMMVDQTTNVEGVRHEKNTSDGYGEDRELEYYVREYGWKVRRMVEDKNEIKKVAQVQAEAFHVPSLFLDDFFLFYFQAEVLSALYYRLRNSPPDRYACLVAEPAKENETLTKSQTHHQQQQQQQQLVGVVDVTVLRDKDVLQHLEGAQEYLYVSGIAVSNNYRRQKVATALLKACEVISVLWGHDHLVLRAYEDDSSARALYTNAGYRFVARDPPWFNWIGRKRRVLMIKCLS